MVNLGVSGLAPSADALEGLVLLGEEGLLLFFDGVDLVEDEAEAGGEEEEKGLRREKGRGGLGFWEERERRLRRGRENGVCAI